MTRRTSDVRTTRLLLRDHRGAEEKPGLPRALDQLLLARDPQALEPGVVHRAARQRLAQVLQNVLVPPTG